MYVPCDDEHDVNGAVGVHRKAYVARRISCALRDDVLHRSSGRARRCENNGERSRHLENVLTLFCARSLFASRHDDVRVVIALTENPSLTALSL